MPEPETERIPLQRRVAVIKPDSIAVRQSRAGLLGPLVQALIAGGAVFLIATFINALPLLVLMLLLLVALILGPAAILGLVYNVAGTAFLMERAKGSARWQQGFLGLGLGTHELVPFGRIEEIRVDSDYDEELESGELQDVVQWDVRLVKDNGRVLDIGSVVAARPLAYLGAERANRLAEALAEMAGSRASLAPVPPPPPEELEGAEAAEPASPARPRRRFRRIDRAAEE